MDRRIGLEVAFDPFEHRVGPLLRRAVGQLRHHDEIALVLFRKKAFRQSLEQPRRHGQQYAEEQHDENRPRQERADDTGKSALRSPEVSIEERPESAARFMLREEHHRAQSRAQRQRHKP